MKKFYFYGLMACLMLFANSAMAGVSMMSDLFGKYKFTATIETTEAGAAHADKFKSECEVIITKSQSQYFMADITGFAGADYAMSVSGFDAAKSAFEVSGPNSGNYGLWNGYIAVANAEGEWPFSLWNVEGSQQFGMTFNFDPSTKEITVADFTIVSLAWSPVETATLLATVKNAKLELVEAENVDTSVYPDLTGEWTYDGDIRNDVSPKSFTLNLTAADDTKVNWNATFAFEGYEEFTLPATFDGAILTVPHDTIFLDRENRIRFGTRSSSKEYSGAFTFSYNTKTSMSLYDYIYIRRDSINPETNELAGAFVHQVFDGYVVRENPDAYDWSGTYKVSVSDYENLTDGSVSFPTEFDMVIEKKPGDIYQITKMLGYEDLYISITPSDDDMSANIELGGYSGAMLQFIGSTGDDYAYHVITDANGEATTLKLTRNEDGSLSFEDFTVSYKLYYANSYEPLAIFSGVKAQKEVFDWAGTYTLTADVESVDGNEYPATFNVEVEYNEAAGIYFVKSFMDKDVYSLNQGMFTFDVAENGKSATIAVDAYYGLLFVYGTFPDYVIIKDAEGGSNALKLTLGAGNVVAMDNFSLYALNYETYASSAMAVYSNVTLVKVAVEEPETPAVDYTPTNTGTKTRNDRNVTGIELLSGAFGSSAYTLSADEQAQDYTDATANVVLKAAPGEELTVNVTSTGSWVHFFVYVDVDGDGFTAGIEEGSDFAPTGDLVAYSFYNNNSSNDEYGWNSVGGVVTGDNRDKPAVPAFTAPAEAGTYRMRIKQDWCNIDPMGDADGKFGDFKANGGQIIDVILEVAVSDGIENVVTDENTVIYDLTGRKVENISAKGIYIVNGKKVMVK
ncbi:MAG: hypothetical protein IKZ37_06415 [Bacteroidaceae bacterium]|nr:hypothetical protein [Bacteroidaceae bacterium]